MSKLVVLLVLLTSCGFSGNQKLTAQGETNHNVNVNLTFVQQIINLCETAYPNEAQLQAECALENINLLNIDLNPEIGNICGQLAENGQLPSFCDPNDNIGL
jgi:hypothetical protein